MNLTPTIDIVTVNDIRAIDSHVNNKETSDGQARRILKFGLFNAKEIYKSTRGRYYYASEEVDAIYNYYKENYPAVFSKRNISCFDDLLVKAFDYCERYYSDFKAPVQRYQ
ncbi:TPA: hypothetical protein QCU33_005434 [Bacillus cereus]|nr:hypothetical protein [Bacillus cereus]